MPELKNVAISADALNMAYGDQIILDQASLTIHECERVGLVGRNGCGKSTFMKILAGIEELDSGDITRKKDLQIGFLPQEFTLDESANVYENILRGAHRLTEMVHDYESLPQNSPRFHGLEEAINRMNGWNLEYKIESIMTAIRCPAKDREIINLSGGEKRRVALARVLIAEPEFILLDEPTNHLDTSAIEWLEEYLQSYRGTCLLVTHDRYFLDRISTRIIELSRGKFHSFSGNYSDYLEAKSIQVEREELAEHRRQKFLKKELEWVRRGPKARTTKAQFRVNRYYDIAAQKVPEQELDVELIIPIATRMGNRAVELTKVTMAYADKLLFKDLTFEFKPGAKIGVIGPNGVGKSTLIKTIIGKIRPTKGTIDIAKSIQFNYIDQERLKLNDEKTVVDEIGDGTDFVSLGNERISIWGYLKRFLFTDERIRTQVGRLSGGERARLLLAKILKCGGNFIVLDEPTNDLDLSTLRLLEDALVGFKGCVLIVSHDRYFLNRVCTGILAFEKNGHVFYNVGNYDYYMSKRAGFFMGTPAKKSASNLSGREQRCSPKVRKLKWKEERELESIEENILKIEEEIDKLQELFTKPDFYKENQDRVKDFQHKLGLAQTKRDELYQRWEELEYIKNSGTA